MKRLLIHLPRIESVPGGVDRLPPPMRALLARARRFDRAASEVLPELLDCPRLPAPAALSRLADPGVGDDPTGSYWLRFDAVRLVPDLTAVWLDGTLPMDFTAPEFESIVGDLQAMFADEGLAWKPRPGCGYGLLELATPPDCRFVSPEDARGARLDEVLPAGPDAARWRRMINLSQMIFHQYRALDRGDQQGVGLWFWGGGELPGRHVTNARYRIVDGADDDMVRGLAHWLGGEYARAGESLEDDPESICYLHWPLVDVDADAALIALVEQWLTPAARMLARGGLGELAIAGSWGCWRLRRLDRLAVWRRSAKGFAPEGFAPEGPA